MKQKQQEENEENDTSSKTQRTDAVTDTREFKDLYPGCVRITQKPKKSWIFDLENLKNWYRGEHRASFILD